MKPRLAHRINGQPSWRWNRMKRAGGVFWALAAGLLLLQPSQACGGVSDEYALRQTLQHRNDRPQGSGDAEYPVAMWGNRMIVGAPYNDALGADVGSATVYERSALNGLWQKLGSEIRPPAGILGDGPNCQFGASVAIWSDRIAVTARDQEIVCLFRWQNGQWAPDGTVYLGSEQFRVTGLEFGAALALEGDYLLVGAPADIADVERSGRAYLYKRNGAVNPPRWDFVKQFEPAVRNRSGGFGSAVDLSGDRAAIGYEISDLATPSGDVFIYRRGANQTWSLEGTLPHVRSPYDSFGITVKILGTQAMVGQRGRPSVLFYTYENGQWRQTASFSDLGWAQSVNFSANNQAAAIETRLLKTRVVTYKLNGAAWVRTGDFQTPELPPSDNRQFFGPINTGVDLENGTLIVGGSGGQDERAVLQDMGYLYDLRNEDTFNAANLLGTRTTEWFAAAKGVPISYWIDVVWDARVPVSLRNVRVELWDVRNITSLASRYFGAGVQNRDSASGEFTPTAGNLPYRFVLVQSHAGTWPANVPGPTVTVRYRYLWGSRN